MKSKVGATYVRYTRKEALKGKECLFSKEGEESRPTNDQQVSNSLPQKISWLGEVVGISAANVRGGWNGWISGIYSRKGAAKLNRVWECQGKEKFDLGSFKVWCAWLITTGTKILLVRVNMVEGEGRECKEGNSYLSKWKIISWKMFGVWGLQIVSSL